MTIAVVAEKPSVARDIAQFLGATRRGRGVLTGNGWAVTWAIGHLVRLPEPHEIESGWKRWRAAALPMLPGHWPLQVIDKTRDQFDVVRTVINSPRVEEVICATDAGREGELIFRYLYEAARCKKPVRRLWVSSLTPEALEQAFDRMRPGSDYDPLAAAATGRSRADWLVGMNLSRATTLAHDETLTVGRVQTPTLAMVVEREITIRDFVPEDYYEVEADFAATPPGSPPSVEVVGRGSAASSDEDGDDDDTDGDDSSGAGSDVPRYAGTWFTGESPDGDGARRLGTLDEARAVAERALTGEARIASVDKSRRRMPAPRLYDLTELQRHANRLYGMSAQQTLGVAQSLYEDKKLISYPRTDSKYLSPDVARTLGSVVGAFTGRYASLPLVPATGQAPLGSRYVDASKVTDHHAIIPTTTNPARVTLSRDEERIYDLICRRLLQAWQPPYVTAITNVVTEVTTPAEASGEPTVDRFHSRGTVVEDEGWKALDVVTRRSAARKRAAEARRRAQQKKQTDGDDGEGSAAAVVDDSRALPAWLEAALEVFAHASRVQEKQTRPPRRYTEATLLTAMETAGRQLDDEALAEAMKDSGLGTPATRAAIFENLLRRGYIERQGKSLHATELGIRLIDAVHPHVKSPEMTGQWEAMLAAIQRGEDDLDSFLQRIEGFVREVVGSTLAAGPGRGDRPSAPPPGGGGGARVSGGGGSGAAVPRTATGQASSSRRAAMSPQAAAVRVGDGTRQTVADAIAAARTPPKVLPPPCAREPVEVDGLEGLLHEVFGFEGFRPHQREVCEAVTAGRDALLIMPTGAGKSLCYQLPGIARAGTTLVISPLIALMEDQATKLISLGLRADRIHSGRTRLESRAACVQYLKGELDFLFIAPERLKVPGFLEMLARRKPGLIAVDEAHCISQWGHDFRPDYRMLGERLPALLPTPIIALTATATPRVQDDIARQLGLEAPQRFIHGFRRTNIAVEMVEVPRSARLLEVQRVLAVERNRPAIVYAPTRRETEALADVLGKRFPTSAYHAGMDTEARERVQSAFLSGELEVIVATIAFGMGVDKPDVRTVIHTGLPGSVEAYYQEIGRAGRDGKLSRAILMYAWADRKTHEFFLERDYPDPARLRRVFKLLREAARPLADLQAATGIKGDDFAVVVDKLAVHGGLRLEDEFHAVLGPEPRWERRYVAQRDHRLQQLEDMIGCADSTSCRMVHLVQHFGDEDGHDAPCGHCDICAPRDCVVQKFRTLVPDELALLKHVLGQLRQRDDQSTGQLHRALGPDGPQRRDFQRLVEASARAGLVRLVAATFQKENGEEVRYQRAQLTAAGRNVTDARLMNAVVVPVAIEAPSRKRGRSRNTRSKARGANTDTAGRKASPKLVKMLKAWRLRTARKHDLRAYNILTNNALLSVAAEQPTSRSALLRVHGVGQTTVDRYGDEILAVIAAQS